MQLIVPLKWKSLLTREDTDPQQTHAVSLPLRMFSESVSESIITCRKLEREKKNKRKG